MRSTAGEKTENLGRLFQVEKKRRAEVEESLQSLQQENFRLRESLEEMKSRYKNLFFFIFFLL